MKLQRLKENVALSDPKLKQFSKGIEDLKNGHVIWRGINTPIYDDFWFSDRSTGEPRQSVYSERLSPITQHLSNWDKRWEPYPDRGHSIFGAIDKKDALDFGSELSVIIPHDSARIASCVSDFNFPESWRGLNSVLDSNGKNAFADLIEDVNRYVGPWNDKTIQGMTIEKFQKILEEEEEYLQQIGIEFNADIPTVVKMLGPNENGFEVVDRVSKITNPGEVWFSGPTLHISDVYINEFIEQVNI